MLCSTPPDHYKNPCIRTFYAVLENMALNENTISTNVFEDDFNEFIEETHEEEERKSILRKLHNRLDWKTSIVVSVIVLTFATTLNAIVLKIYRARQKDMNKKFVVTLAVVDILACWVIRILDVSYAVASVSGFEEAYEVLNLVTISSLTVVLSVYTSILLLWALERLFAVACPFTFQEKLKVFRPIFFAFAALNLISLSNFFSIVIDCDTNSRIE